LENPANNSAIANKTAKKKGGGKDKGMGLGGARQSFEERETGGPCRGTYLARVGVGKNLTKMRRVRSLCYRKERRRGAANIHES